MSGDKPKKNNPGRRCLGVFFDFRSGILLLTLAMSGYRFVLIYLNF